MAILAIQAEFDFTVDARTLLRLRVLDYFMHYAPTRSRTKTLQHCLLWLNYRHGFELRDHRSIRDAIKDLRREGKLICSMGGVGHWMAENREQVYDYVNAELRAKALDLMITARKQRLAAVNYFGGQMEQVLRAASEDGRKK